MNSNSTPKSTPDRPKKIRDVHSVLSQSELEQLQDKVSGYGWMADSARKAGLHKNTIYKVLRNGYGRPATINIIRNSLLQ